MSYLVNNIDEGMGLRIPVIGGEAIGSHKQVCLNSDGKWYLADANTVTTMPTIGMSCGPIEENGAGVVLLIGLISSSEWNWSLGGVNGLLYTSTEVGELTQTKPLSAGDQVQIVGTVITETLILFNPNYVLVEVA